MRKISCILTLLVVVLFTTSTASADDKTGLTFFFEYRSLDLPADDDLKIVGPAVGYTADWDGWFGQFGLRLDHFMLDRPSVEGKTFYEGCETPPDYPFPEERGTYTLESEFTYWGVGPMLGFRFPIVEEWFGVDFLVSTTFPITNDSKGWGFEAGGFGYLTLDGLIGLDLGVVAGGKFGHIDHEADRYSFEENRMMPSVGAMLRF